MRARHHGATAAVFAAARGLALAGAVCACTGTRDVREPGEKLGTFAVDGKLLATTCGKADATFRFSVRLSREGSTLYWVQSSSAAATSGAIDADGNVRMVAEVDAVVAKADAKTGAEGCTMRRTDSLTVALRGEPPTGFEGALVYRFEAKAGDCSTELATAGGDYATLPCTMTYEVSASATK